MSRDKIVSLSRRAFLKHGAVATAGLAVWQAGSRRGATAAGQSSLGRQLPFNPLPKILETPLGLGGSEAALQRLSEGSGGKTPTVKNFTAQWVRSLQLRGSPKVHTHANISGFQYIGMPVGGIGTGQVYLGGACISRSPGGLLPLHFSERRRVVPARDGDAVCRDQPQTGHGHRGNRRLAAKRGLHPERAGYARRASQPSCGFTGKHSGRVCRRGSVHSSRHRQNLRIGGKVVRTATGRNGEALNWANWNISGLHDQEAQIEIVDRESGGWGTS